MAWAMLAAAHAAHAAHPLLTEDTGTQGTGNAELELGFSWTRYGADRLFAFQPQLSYGLLDTLDLIVQPAWLVNRTASAGTSRGFGDTLADIKWRFFERAPVSFAVRGGFSFPTSQGELGLPHGQVSPHALIVTTLDAAPFALDANVGYIRYPGGPGVRQNLYHASAAAVYTATERMLLVADVAFDSNPDSARSTAPGVLLVGTVFTLRHGLDIDIGYQTRLNHAAPAWQWLLGITYRWTP